MFHRLSAAELLQIVDIQTAEVVRRASEQGLRLVLTPEARDFLVRIGSSDEYGARPLRRAVQQYVEDPLAELLLRGGLNRDTEIMVRPSDTGDRLAFDGAARAAEGVTS